MSAPLRRASAGSEPSDLAATRWMEDHPLYGVITTDEIGSIRIWNPWMELHTGRSARSVVGRELREVLPELEERKLLRYFEAASKGQIQLLSQRLHGFLLRMPTNGGSGRFEHMQQSAQIAPLTLEGRIVGVIATIKDVTDRVTLEAEMRAELLTRARLLADERAARAEADASNRAKDEFLAVLSHELRTPLHTILGWAQVLREGRVSQDELTNGIVAIQRNALLQTQLIEDLLDASRIVSGAMSVDLKPVVLRNALDAALASVAPAAEAKAVELAVSIDDGLAPVMGDARRLQQVFWNLLGNAVKFTPQGGTVSLHATSSAGPVAITVTDAGEGISAAFLPHVFDRFRQNDSSATRPQGGLGLGLTIVKRLVELHGGTVTAQSAGLGLGATFVVTLPRAEGDRALDGPSSAGALLAASESAPFMLAGLNLLFVEDDADGREIMALALSMEGADVVVACSAAEARQALSQRRPDVMISDIGMPGEDGYALMRGIRAASVGLRRLPAIALTGFASLDDKRRARDAGFDAHLTKPVDLATLISAVATLSRPRV